MRAIKGFISTAPFALFMVYFILVFTVGMFLNDKRSRIKTLFCRLTFIVILSFILNALFY